MLIWAADAISAAQNSTANVLISWPYSLERVQCNTRGRDAEETPEVRRPSMLNIAPS